MAPIFTGNRFGFGRRIVASASGLSVSGGNQEVTPGNGYKYHTFTSSGNFTITGGEATVDMLIVAGGGGAGTPIGSGGGGGGVVYAPGRVLLAGTYPIVVGDGGAGATGQGTPGSNTLGSRGSDSTADGLTAVGGGGGHP